ncbi:MAG: TrkH family potassium uptake protein [Desulfomonilaceae bacterium]
MSGDKLIYPPGFVRRYVFAMFTSPQATLVLGFAGVIFVGAVILSLSWCQQERPISFLDALFTSTSAVCVTGLTVLDVGKDYNLAGQCVLMLLIQAGGLGVMTFAGLAFQLMGRRMSLQSEAVLHDTFFQRQVRTEFWETFRAILVLTALVECVGAIALSLLFLPKMPWHEAVFSGLFHSISAFCNAGFSLLSDNLLAVREQPLILVVVMILIVLGGLGFTVLHEMYAVGTTLLKSEPCKGARRQVSFHAKVVLVVSGFLVLGGAGGLAIFGLTSEETSMGDVAINALFQSVTARTAGFNSVDIGKLPAASLLLLTILMFIGGSPGSAAGGIKTTSAAILGARILSGLRGRRSVSLANRAIPWEIVNRTDLLVALALLWNLVGVFFLFIFESQLRVDTLQLLFEQISAFGTVGLSTGITPSLSSGGKIWLIATMFVGRLGPLTIALWAIPRDNLKIRYPRGRVMIG